MIFGFSHLSFLLFAGTEYGSRTFISRCCLGTNFQNPLDRPQCVACTQKEQNGAPFPFEQSLVPGPPTVKCRPVLPFIRNNGRVWHSYGVICEYGLVLLPAAVKIAAAVHRAIFQRHLSPSLRRNTVITLIYAFICGGIKMRMRRVLGASEQYEKSRNISLRWEYIRIINKGG